MKSKSDELKLFIFEYCIDLVIDECNHQPNCANCPFCYENGQCAVMVKTGADDAPCDW